MCFENKAIFKPKYVHHDYRIKDLKTLTKDISCECNCRFHGKKCNSDQ